MAELSKKIAVAVSGSGRSLENFALFQNVQGGYQVAAVIASSANCPAIAIAKSFALPVFIGNFPLAAVGNQSLAHLFDWLRELDIQLVALAGFLKPFPCSKDWHDRIVNIHPALLPKYGGKGMYGMNVHRAVLAAGDPESGATVHFVNEQYDSGAIIAQSKVAVTPEDSAETLAANVFASECEMYPQVIAGLLAGSLPLPAGKVKIYRGKNGTR